MTFTSLWSCRAIQRSKYHTNTEFMSERKGPFDRDENCSLITLSQHFQDISSAFLIYSTVQCKSLYPPWFIVENIYIHIYIYFLSMWHGLQNDSQFGLHDKMLPLFTLAVWESTDLASAAGLLRFDMEQHFSFRDFRISPRVWELSYVYYVIAVG